MQSYKFDFKDAQITESRRLGAEFLPSRRNFLSLLMAGAGSAALTACGGGDSSAVADSVVKAARAASPDGTAIPSAASIVDSAGSTWTLVNNRVTKNGASVATGSPKPLTLILWYGGAIYAQNSAGTWYRNGSPWTAIGTRDPRTNTAYGVLLDTSFGVKGDGKTNDRAALQAAIDGSVGQILMITGQSRIDMKGLDLRGKSHIRFAPGASIKLLPYNAEAYQMIRVWDVDGVIIENAYLDGSKELNASNTGEWGMAISINGATNLTIESPTTINCWGDGIYLDNSCSGSNAYSKNITINNHHAIGCRRQGMSIGSVSGLVLNSPIWENIGGTAPGAGLDIEPDNSATVLENIKIVNPTSKNCSGPGIQIWLSAFAGPTKKNVNISITGHTDVSSKVCAYSVQALRLNGYVVTGSITSASPVWNRPLNQAYLYADWDQAGPTVSVTNPKIVN